MYDRWAKRNYIDALTGGRKSPVCGCATFGGQQLAWRQQPAENQSNRYVLQLGGDVRNGAGGQSRWAPWRDGGGLQESQQHRSSRTGYRSEVQSMAPAPAFYATWYANDASRQRRTAGTAGLQYSWFDNNVKGDDLAGADVINPERVTASLEMGYARKWVNSVTVRGTLNNGTCQPQAQAVWMGVADDHRESSGTRITSHGNGNVPDPAGAAKPD